MLATASNDCTLRLWEVPARSTPAPRRKWYGGYEPSPEAMCVGTLQGHTGAVFSCRFSPDDTRVLSASMDGTVKLWDVEQLQLITTLRGHAAPVHCAVFANEEGTRIVSAARDRTLKVWDVSSGKGYKVTLTLLYCVRLRLTVT